MNSSIQNQKFYLPTRNLRNLGDFKSSNPLHFTTNFYNVKIKPSFNRLYLYEVKFSDQIPQDSAQIAAKVLFSLRAQLKQSIGFVCFSGMTVYGLKQNKNSLSYNIKFEGNSIQTKIKLTKQINMIQLLNDCKTRPSIFHFLNSKIKSYLRSNDLCELGKIGQFYQKDQLLNKMKSEMKMEYENLERSGLNVLRGYKFTLVMINKSLKLQIDVCSRVLQKNSLLQQFQDFIGTNKELQEHFKDQTIITRYGNYRTYKIQEIDFQKSPASTFECKGKMISYQQYYKKAYNADIFQIKQPLIKVQSKKIQQITKAQQIEIKKEYIYLIPQLISLTGMKDVQRNNFQSMKALTPFTKLEPEQRFIQSSKILNILKEAEDFIEVGQKQVMRGYKLKDPVIRYKDQAMLRNGNMNNRSQLYKPHHFKNWFFVYTVQSNNDVNDAVNIQNCLKEASKVYGITYENPRYLQIQLNKKFDAGNFCLHIQKQFRAKRDSNSNEIQPQCQLIFIILKANQQNSYGTIKQRLTNSLSVPCQVVLSKTFHKKKNVLSVASKIAIQMSCKAGDAPWIVCSQLEYFKKKTFAYAAISSSKGKGGFTISFVGTINKQCTSVYSHYITHVKRKDKIEGIDLMVWFQGWIKSYFMKNKFLPELLIVYRQSVGDSLLKHVLKHEIENFKQAIQKVRIKAKKPAYNPELVYIFVNKKINSRFFKQTNHQLSNPQPGSVIIEDMSIDNSFDFHLVAQKVNQGTATPTHYIVGYDSSTIGQEDLVRFTYEQCYNYYNWEGSVKIPSCLQCANKLSKLASESIKQDFKPRDKKIGQTYYFL